VIIKVFKREKFDYRAKVMRIKNQSPCIDLCEFSGSKVWCLGCARNRLECQKNKAHLRSLPTLVMITTSCAAIANDVDKNMQTASERALEIIQVIGNKVTSISESGSRLDLSLKKIPATIDIISGDDIRA